MQIRGKNYSAEGAVKLTGAAPVMASAAGRTSVFFTGEYLPVIRAGLFS